MPSTTLHDLEQAYLLACVHDAIRPTATTASARAEARAAFIAAGGAA